MAKEQWEILTSLGPWFPLGLNLNLQDEYLCNAIQKGHLLRRVQLCLSESVHGDYFVISKEGYSIGVGNWCGKDTQYVGLPLMEVGVILLVQKAVVDWVIKRQLSQPFSTFCAGFHLARHATLHRYKAAGSCHQMILSEVSSMCSWHPAVFFCSI